MTTTTTMKTTTLTWLTDWMAEWLDGWMDGWMNEWMNKCYMDGWMDGWITGWVDGWMDGWMDGWILRASLFITFPWITFIPFSMLWCHNICNFPCYLPLHVKIAHSVILCMFSATCEIPISITPQIQHHCIHCHLSQQASQIPSLSPLLRTCQLLRFQHNNYHFSAVTTLLWSGVKMLCFFTSFIKFWPWAYSSLQFDTIFNIDPF